MNTPITGESSLPVSPSSQLTETCIPQQQQSAKEPIGQIDDYLLLSEIARGGMGVVYRARHIRLNKPVAVKLIKSGNFAGDEEVRRFQNEALAAAKLDHPGIVSVHQVGVCAGQNYLAMDLVDGTSLWQQIKEAPLEPRTAAQLIRQVAQAVDYAHHMRVIHRDLKPQNILLTKEGRPKITDFGLAKALDGDSSLTVPGQILGTPGYMPPEQAEGKTNEIGPPADVYSLGATLYSALTGRPPFQAATPHETIRQVIEQEPARLRQLNHSVPADLETICHKCLEKNPARRYATAADLADDLDRFDRGLAIRARPVSQAEHAWRWCQRNPGIAGWSTTAVFLLITATAVSTLAWIRETRLVGEKVQLISQKDLLLGEKEGLLTEKAGLITETKQLADSERQTREKVEQRELELRIESAKTALTRGVAEFDAGRPQAANRDFLRALALLPETHELRPSYLRIAWDRATQFGRIHRILGMKASAAKFVAFSPDGARLLTSTGPLSPGTAQLWDAVSGDAIGAPMQHAGRISSASFSPDGRRVMTASLDQSVRFWSASTGEPLGEPLQHDDAVRFAAFSPDGSLVVVTTWEPRRPGGKAWLWDAGSGTLIGQPMGHAYEVPHAAFSPDGKLLVTASATTGRNQIAPNGQVDPEFGTAQIWDALTALPIGEPLLHTQTVEHVSFNSLGTRLATLCTDGNVRLWDVAGGMKLAAVLYCGQTFVRPAFNPAGTQVVTALGNDAVLWDVATGTRIGRLMPHQELVRSVAFTPDGRRILTNCRDRSLQLWDARTQRALGPPITQDSWTISAAVNPDGSRVATATGDNTLVVWNLDSEGMSPVNPPSRSSWQAHLRAELSSDGTRVVTTHMSPEARILDAATFIPICEPLRHERNLNTAAFSPDGERVVTASDDLTARVWDGHTGKPLGEPLRHEAFVRFATFSPQGTSVATVTAQKLAFLWDSNASLQDQQPVRIASDVVQLSFSQDGSSILFVQPGAVRFWDLGSRTLRDVNLQHTIPILSALLHPRGAHVLTQHADYSVSIFNLATGRQEVEPLRHEGYLRDAGYSPDGTQIVTSSGDLPWKNMTRLWDARTGVAVGLPFWHEHGIATARLSPEGARLITSSPDGLRAWDVEQSAPPVEFGIEALETLTFLEVDHLGIVRDMSGDERERRQRRLVSDNETWWRACEAQAARRHAAFHRRSAEVAEAEADWPAAAFHWRCVLHQSAADDSIRGRWEIARQNSRYEPRTGSRALDDQEPLMSFDYSLNSTSLPKTRLNNQPFLKDGSYTIEDGPNTIWLWNFGHVLQVGERIRLKLRVVGAPDARVGISLQDDGKKPSRTSGMVAYLTAGGEFGIDPESNFVEDFDRVLARTLSIRPHAAVRPDGNWNEMEIANLGTEIRILINDELMQTIDRTDDRLEHPILALVLKSGTQTATAQLAKFTVFSTTSIADDLPADALEAVSAEP